MVPRILHPHRHRRYPAPARHSPAPLRETHRRHGRLHQRGNPSNSVRLLSGLERRGPSTAAELGAMIDIDRSVISRHASILEQAGPLARSPDERDRRWTALSLTEKKSESCRHDA
ncbi:MarR family winged helix-turn-helix transcriptional regulator [Cutibacterium modestum]|uniref:MarR family winged helix-turn-helix transcriptional regulator n=1 Tax=Cutibacterium modestum TaxID=2559073 RepID=UPI001E5DAF96|nr:MarR family winged helix-turn-helix transcriptional regulator [Cutibacterium modestum]